MLLSNGEDYNIDNKINIYSLKDLQLKLKNNDFKNLPITLEINKIVSLDKIMNSRNGSIIKICNNYLYACPR